jgi:hypothetical protein
MCNLLIQQPNGLYCIFSGDTNCPICYNITKEEYISMKKQEAEQIAIETLNKNVVSFDMLTHYFIPTNMSEDEFEKIIKEMTI